MNHQFKKKFGQNFIRDENLLKKIVQLAGIENSFVVEIGPGMGALTKHLIKVANKVMAFEIDQTLKPTLDAIEDNSNVLEVIYEDILGVDLSHISEPFHVIGNIPYNITTPIIFKLAEIERIQSITLMMQEEVGYRIAAKPNTKEYNALSVILQHQYNIEKLLKVHKKMFYPVPKIDSVVIKFTPKNKIDPAFNQFVKACFKQKRKTLVNNLSEQFDLSKERIIQSLDFLELNTNIRAEALNLHNFLEIKRQLNL